MLTVPGWFSSEVGRGLLGSLQGLDLALCWTVAWPQRALLERSIAQEVFPVSKRLHSSLCSSMSQSFYLKNYLIHKKSVGVWDVR